MIFIFTVMLLTAIIIAINSSKFESARWAVFFITTSSCIVLHQIFHDSLLPFLGQFPHEHIQTVKQYAQLSGKVFEFTGHYLTPYGVIMYAVVTSEKFGSRMKKCIASYAIIPVIIMLVMYVNIEDAEKIHSIGLIWIAPYVLIASFLLIITSIGERNKFKRNNNKYVALIVVPPSLSIFLLHDVANVYLPGEHLYRYLPIFFGYAFLMFVYSMLRNGMFGMKLKFEKQVLDNTMKNVTVSTGLLNHAIKNKITINNLILERILRSSCTEQIHKDANVILKNQSDLLGMIQRIHKQTDDISIIKQPTKLVSLLHEALHTVKDLLEQYQVEVQVHTEIEVEFLGDKIHLQEAFVNIIKNALEAMIRDRPNYLYIEVTETKKWIELKFTDSGTGIPKELLGDIFKPFITTKERIDKNFGLGLTYCYLIFQKHGGDIFVESTSEAGTTITMMIPKGAVIQIIHNEDHRAC